MRPPRRQGARADDAVRPHARSPRGSRPTCSDVPTVLVARTDALAATLLTSDVDERDARVRDRRAHGGGLLPRPRRASTRRSPAALAYAPYADLLWFETSTPDLGEARAFADGDPRAVPRQAARVQLLAVVQLAQAPRRREIASFQRELAEHGLPLPVHHARRLPLAERGACSSSRAATRPTGMSAYVRAPGARVRRSRSTATRPRATSARSAPATSTWSPGGLGGESLDARAEGLDRGGAVRGVTA